MSYCIDVVTGPREVVRRSLCQFLKAHIARGIWPHALVAMHGMWMEDKILRILTEHATELQRYIIDNFNCVYLSSDSDDDFNFTIHESEVDARRSMYYLPDFDTKDGCEPFNL